MKSLAASGALATILGMALPGALTAGELLEGARQLGAITTIGSEGVLETSPSQLHKEMGNALYDKSVILPVTGVVVVQTGSGVKAISRNGRFVFDGQIYDTWNNTSIHTLEDAKRMASTLKLDGLNFDLAQLAPYSIGSGPLSVAIFVDPLCPYCKTLLDTLPQQSDTYTFHLIPIPVLSKESAKVAVALECSKDQRQALRALLLEQYDGLTQFNDQCSHEPIAKRMMASQVLGVDVVPFIVSPSGTLYKGVPKMGLINWLRGQHQ